MALRFAVSVAWWSGSLQLNMTCITCIFLACRSLALQPLHCWNILNRIRQCSLCADPQRWCWPTLGYCLCQGVMPHHANTTKQLFCPDPSLMDKSCHTMSGRSVSQICLLLVPVHVEIYFRSTAPLTCRLILVQELHRLARAASDLQAHPGAGAALAGSCSLCQAGAYQTGSGQPLWR